jgi:hypothetical protein
MAGDRFVPLALNIPLALMASVSDNACMADVPLYVAVITAGAGIVGAAIPQAGILLSDFRRANRDRRDRSDAAAQNSCIEMLRASSTLSVNVENLCTYRGNPDGLRSRLEEVRKDLADTRLQAVSVGMLAPSPLTEPAEQLAEAAGRLVEVVQTSFDVNRSVMVGEPDVGPLNALISVFRTEAVRHTGANALTDPVPSRQTATMLFFGRRAEARDR